MQESITIPIKFNYPPPPPGTSQVPETAEYFNVSCEKPIGNPLKPSFLFKKIGLRRLLGGRGEVNTLSLKISQTDF